MRGEQYFLVLIGKDDTLYRVFRKPITLRKMDERTTKYKNKNELIKEILKNTGSYIDAKEIKSVEIWRQPNSKKDEYKKERGPLYQKDASVLNTDGVVSKFELMALDRNFALEFAKRYSKVKNFRSLSVGIQAAINNGESYIELFQELAEKVFSTYKGSRNAYFSMKDYENKKHKKNVKSNKTQSNKDSILYEKDLTKEEFEEVRLQYLLEHERELLDIDDFNNHSEISPFDEHKRK